MNGQDKAAFPVRCGGGYLISGPCPGCGDCRPCRDCKGGGWRVWPGTGRMRPGGMTITQTECERCNGTGVETISVIPDFIAQIDRLATFIANEIPGEPSGSEGAVDTAIRLLRAAYVSGRDNTESPVP